ncbi:autotransporter domain-containing protein [Helicobacter saguini]|nr:autotransporter outer membrane beta-barrel domain-containing protein [Helicobacter saguini]MWV66334.1 autotransporter domain-containing protein [Helicobacter saguini]
MFKIFRNVIESKIDFNIKKIIEFRLLLFFLFIASASAWDVNCITSPTTDGCTADGDYIHLPGVPNPGSTGETNAGGWNTIFGGASDSNNLTTKNNVKIEVVRIHQLNGTSTPVELGIKAGGKIEINNLTNNHNFGIVSVAYNARLFTNADTYINSINHINRTGGSPFLIRVENGKNLYVGKTNFAENGLKGSVGRILLEGHDVTIGDANGRFSQVLDVTASGKLNVTNIGIERLSQADFIGFAVAPESYAAFRSEEEANVQNIIGFAHSQITIDSKKDIRVENATFFSRDEQGNYYADGCITDACRGLIQLSSNGGNVYMKHLAGGTSNESGIGAYNRFKVKTTNGGDFYAGKIEAMSLATALNNGYLDLNEVDGNIYIDDLYMRNSTMYGDNFHMNNLTIWKGNATTSFCPSWLPAGWCNPDAVPDPDSKGAISRIEGSIGKSFINNLSLNIGTSNGADRAPLWFDCAGNDGCNNNSILNINFANARATSYLNAESIRDINIEDIRIQGADVKLGNAIINNLESTRTQVGFGSDLFGGNTSVVANALNINETLHIKNSSKFAGSMKVDLNSTTGHTTTQNFDNYLKVDVDSNTLKRMNAGQIQDSITKAENTITTTNHKNQSGTYITTSDNKHYLLLPGIRDMSELNNYKSDNITATNAGNLLIEQTKIDKGFLNNYGIILVDNRCLESTGQCLGNGVDGGKLEIVGGLKSGNNIDGGLNNYNTIDIGAGGAVAVNGKVNNYGTLMFRIQSDFNTFADKINGSRNGLLQVNGSITLDISPGSTGAFKADITDARSLNYLRLKGEGRPNGNTQASYELIKASPGSNITINYTYTYGDYTTTFNHNGTNASIATKKDSNGACDNVNCQSNVNGDTSQETKWTQGGLKNPWDMEKSEVDSNNGGKVEKPLGENMNNDSILGRPNDSEIKIEKPSQADKYADCKVNGNDKYCGFGNDKNATEAERGYDYAIERMKNSFTITYQGGNIDGKYLQVEKVVTPQVIGFNVIKKEIFNPSGSEIPLCNAESSSFDCVLYMEAGGNNSWINALKKESKNSYNILKDLFYNENSELLMLIQLDQSLAISRNLDYFLEVGRTLDTTMQHVSSLENKSSTLQTLNLAMDSAKSNRLARVAYFQSPEYEALAFQEYRANVEKASELASQVRALRNNYAFNGNIESKGVKVASIESNNLESNNAVMDDSDSNNPNAAHHPIISVAAVANHHSNTETIYDTADNTDSNNNEAWFNTIADLIVRFSTRGENPNNLWANAIGNVSFSTTGSNQLYGFNAGYDYYSKLLHTAFGLYVGYGYGIFTGNNNGYISNNSQNLFAGIYTRTFIGNNEFDMTISASRGFVNESIQAQKRGFDLLDLFNQKYHYNVTNLEGNVTYGYAFILKKGYTLKPFLGASYYISTSTGYNRQASGIFEIDTSDNARHAIGVNVGIEGRKYFKNQSYIFLNAQFRQDVYVLKDNLDSKRLSSSNVSNTESNLAFTFDYRGDSLRSNMFVTAGGELALGRFYINTSLTSHTSVISKAFGFGANAGFRFVF